MSPLPPNQVFDQRSPIYLQIVEWVLRAIASGQLLPGEEIPSRRALAATVGINPMTVQKAYRVLEEDGVILTEPNSVSRIATTPELATRVRQQLAESDGRAFIVRARALGLDLREITVMLDELWNREEEHR